MDSFTEYPATLTIQTPEGAQVFISSNLWVEPVVGNDGQSAVLVSNTMGSERSWPVESWEKISSAEWQGSIWTSDGEGPTFAIRQTLPRDAEDSSTMEGFPRIPMPLDVISYYHANTEYEMPELYAMTDNDEFVVTMMLTSPAGVYLRYASAWRELPNADVIDGLGMHSVTAASLDLFDEADRQGQVVAISAMESSEGEPLDVIPGVMEDIPTGPDLGTSGVDAVLASAGKELRLSGPEDVESAIAAAADLPELQWWVERRLGALGIEADLPWS